MRESNEWFNIIAWGDLAKAANGLLHRDQRVFTEGSLQTRSWDDEEGQRQVRTEVVASKLIPMDSREDLLKTKRDSFERILRLPLPAGVTVLLDEFEEEEGWPPWSKPALLAVFGLFLLLGVGFESLLAPLRVMSVLIPHLAGAPRKSRTISTS